MAELNPATSTFINYVYFGGDRVARRDGITGPISYYFSDHLKTASVVTDSTGNNIEAESDYYPWGGELQFVNNDSNHYKFTGKERDSESGLDYFGARYYSNGLGRFISADWSATPIPVPYADFGDPQSLNLYSYVRNIPTIRIDADGHCDWCHDVMDAIAGSAYNFFAGARSWSNAYHSVSRPGGDAEAAETGAGSTPDKVWTPANVTQQEVGNGTTAVLVAASSMDGGEFGEGEGTFPRGGTPTEEISQSTTVSKEVPESIPAGPSPRPTAAQQRAINEMGDVHGCHTCGTKSPGTKSGNWVGDHQPETALKASGQAQVYKPQCLQCSRRQGGLVRAKQAKAQAAVRATAQAAENARKDHK